MLIQFAGCQYSDPRVFVENPGEWFNTKITEHSMNICDKFLEVKVPNSRSEITIQAPLQPFFFPEEAYDTYLQQHSIKVYIFPNIDLLIQVAIDNHKNYLNSLNNLKAPQKLIYLFNKWQKSHVSTTLESGSIFEERLNISIDFESNLGRRFDEDQKSCFLKLIDRLISLNDQKRY